MLPSVDSVFCIPTYLKWLLSSRIGSNEVRQQSLKLLEVNTGQQGDKMYCSIPARESTTWKICGDQI